MSTGLVKFFNETKGYGFIKEDDSDTEHFVLVSGLIDRITEGDKVEFELKEGNKGLNAINVKVIS
jgi:CspA family cold shock protein